MEPIKGTYVELDLDKIATIWEVKAVLKLLVMSQCGSVSQRLKVHTDVINTMPILNNLVKDSDEHETT